MKKLDNHVQVCIVGAGVSGCSTAIRLAQKGIKTVLIDKAEFPRDTVGEGLSPAIGKYITELGILDDILACEHVTKKTSLQIVARTGRKAYTKIDFDKPAYQNGMHNFPWGFNVRRKHFDMIFMKKALELGAEIHTETDVKKVLYDEKGNVTGLEIMEKNGDVRTITTDVVLDCSGRNSIIANQLHLRGVLEDVFDGQWANFAIRLHFTNVNMAPLEEGVLNYDPATVNIFPDEDCWYWFIPLDLKKGLISIGFVARYKLKKYIDSSTNREEAYRSLISKHPILGKVIESADMSDNIVATSRLGHMNSKMAGGGFMCIGDSAFFADPAWGTGVTIALHSAFMAADFVEHAVQKNDFSEEMMKKYEEQYRDIIKNPFNSIRAYNYYYNDTEYVDFIVKRLHEHPEEMDMIGAVLFDYASHNEFQKWTFNEFKRFVLEKGRLPMLSKVSQFDFDNETIAGRRIDELELNQ